MQRYIRFPIKGTFYYSAALAMQDHALNLNDSLIFKKEPNNLYDTFAVQILLPYLPKSQHVNVDGMLLGYVPKALSQKITRLIDNQSVTNLQITHLVQRGKWIEIDCKALIKQPLISYLNLLLKSHWVRHAQHLRRLKRRWLDARTPDS